MAAVFWLAKFFKGIVRFLENNGWQLTSLTVVTALSVRSNDAMHENFKDLVDTLNLAKKKKKDIVAMSVVVIVNHLYFDQSDGFFKRKLTNQKTASTFSLSIYSPSEWRAHGASWVDPWDWLDVPQTSYGRTRSSRLCGP